MFESQFDKMTHKFHCQNVKCKAPFEIVLRDLLKADHVHCPDCGRKISIIESKARGAIRKDFDAAEKLDIAARRKEKKKKK